MNTVTDFEKVAFDKVKDELKKNKNKIKDTLGGFFSKKPKFTENEDGTISREIKVCGQTVKITTYILPNGKFMVNLTGNELDEKNSQKLMDKLSQKKKLSDDEKFWLNFKERTAVGQAMCDKGIDTEDAVAFTAYSKDEMTGNVNVGDYILNLDGYTYDKNALLESLKEKMIEVYGKDIGLQRFDELVARSNLTGQLTKLADNKQVEVASTTGEQKETSKVTDNQKDGESVSVSGTDNEKRDEPVDKANGDETVVLQEVSEESEVIENDDPQGNTETEDTQVTTSVVDRAELSASLQGDAEENQQRMTNATKELNRFDESDEQTKEKIAKISKLMERRGVKLQDKEATLNKLVENFGAEAAYKLVLKCMIEPMNAMKAMGEGFKRSGASMEYFAAIAPNDAEKMNKVAALLDVSVEDMPAATRQTDPQETPTAAQENPVSESIQTQNKNLLIDPSALDLNPKTTSDITPDDIFQIAMAEMQYKRKAGR